MARDTRYVIGIDLGTTNCALAYAAVGDESAVKQFHIAQLVGPGEVREQPLLPSVLYLPGAADFPEGSLALPWESNPKWLVGQLAKKRGAEVPHRVVVSAKSWLSHAGVDRTSALLPEGADEAVERVSPVEASRRYLEHLHHAWEARMEGAPFTEQQVLVTVPASFDAVARELTERACALAGYPEVVLLEEPQAAFYAWIERHPDWRERVSIGDLILVVDVGGGTTDFSLIAVTEAAGELRLERVAVGEHILLGGDNMDLAVARHLEHQLAAKGRRLDTAQFHALWQQARAAKEHLLAEGNQDEQYPVTVLGRGSSLLASTIKTAVPRAELEQIVLEGFFPRVPSDELPARTRRTGLVEMGLPYAQDVAITRHLAQFLRQRATASAHEALRRTPSGMAAPTHILFNGGVFRAGTLRERLARILNEWLEAEGQAPAQLLAGEDLMQAVSRGAAYYGLARRGKGVRIRGGIARSYYIGVQAAMPAVPGFKPPLKAFTVAQFGMEEGTKVRLASREFGLLVGEPAEFRFFASVERKEDEPGTMVEDVASELRELAPIEVTLEGEAGQVVPVTLETEITETGHLQLWCVARDGRRWKLEFNVRESVTTEALR
jgi:hypothetical protein